MSTIDDLMTPPEDDENALSLDNILGGGYDPTTFQDWFSSSQVPNSNSGKTYEATTTTIKTWVPGTDGRPAIPYEPPTPPEFAAVVNSGWDSSARSIEPVEKGSFVSYRASAGAHGVFLGLGRRYFDSMPNESIAHGLLVDGAGVWVFERGAATVLLRSAAGVETTLRIIRQLDNEVIYMVVTGSESIFHRSSAQAGIGTLYGYGRLYSSDDIIKDAAITVGKLQFGRA